MIVRTLIDISWLCDWSYGRLKSQLRCQRANAAEADFANMNDHQHEFINISLIHM